MILAVGCLVCLFALCQGKVIEVDNGGNDSNDCCVIGACLCGSLFQALIHVENNTIINITSSISLHNVTSIGSETLLSNVTITGNGVNVTCSSSGAFTCLHCINVVIQGITWDQCGNSDHPNFTHAINFIAVSNISIIGCTFQHSRACLVVKLTLTSGFIAVHDSRFLFNHITNSLQCTEYRTLLIVYNESTMQEASVSITETLFYHNGPSAYSKQYDKILWSVALFCLFNKQQFIKLHIENSTVSTNFGLGGSFDFSGISNATIQLTNMTFYNNSNGGLLVETTGRISEVSLSINSCSFYHNINGSLILALCADKINIKLDRLNIIGNIGNFAEQYQLCEEKIGQGSGLILSYSTYPNIVIVSFCNIQDNIGGISINNGYLDQVVSIISSNFTNNTGSALLVSYCTVELGGNVLFTNNSATRGGAIYLDRGIISIQENSTIGFSGNTAVEYGGAIYVRYSDGCVTSLPNTSHILFINNSASTIYISDPVLCYHLSKSLIPHVVTPLYLINMCSTTCDNANSNCHLPNRNMLGQSIGINATVCEYYSRVSKTELQVYVECTNCNDTFELYNDRILVRNGLFYVELVGVNADSNIVNNTNVTLSLSTVHSNAHKQLMATLSLVLSSCQSGYVFTVNLDKVYECKCYGRVEGIIRCQQDYTEIKHGYWFGVGPSSKRTVSLCPIYYCHYKMETNDDYYKLPEELDDQCSSHRIGIACGECKPGYTLTYDSPDCINTDNCSAGMTVLVVVLTILYWIIIVALVFGLMQRKVSLGYAYGLIYYYSTVDILLGSNLYITDGVFQLVTMLSSFAKLTPQFLGKLCFVQGLSGIDQRFIHYFHAMSIFFIIFVVVMSARYSPKIASIVSRCIIRVICLLILLSYTSLASASLQLLRPVYFEDVNGAYVYSSPSIKYFTGRHIPYGIIALLCGLFIVIGLPLLLLLEPFLKRKVSFIKIKPLLDQYQESYKDQYHWFAAYYLICRLVIIAIVYVSNFISSLYYLQTACIIIVTIHVWIKPYKSEILNVLDGIILLMIVLVVNLNSFTFSRSSVITIVVITVIFPVLLSSLIVCKTVVSAMKWFRIHKNFESDQERVLNPVEDKEIIPALNVEEMNIDASADS